MWTIFTEEIYNDDMSYTSYGVRNGCFCLPDFSSVKSEAQQFAKLLNKYDVSPVHAADVAEDYFGSAEFLR